MTTYLLAGLGVIALIAFVINGARRRSAKIVISAPVLGVLNLAEQAGENLAAQDLGHVGPLFATTRRSERDPPSCDVLLLYCDLEANGTVKRSARGLRELIRDSGATIVVVAKNHPVEAYIAAAPQLPFGQANLVMTLDRKGTALPTFLARLFGKMSGGIPMPVAWNTLAPQTPGMNQDAPEAVFSCERGQVAFGAVQPGVAAAGAVPRS